MHPDEITITPYNVLNDHNLHVDIRIENKTSIIYYYSKLEFQKQNLNNILHIIIILRRNIY